MRPEPDCAALHLELRRPGVTLALLHVEYLSAHPDGLRYTAFCDRYRAWQKRQSPVMRQVHVAGDKLFVDYAGMSPRIVDPVTGEVIEVELFVAVLGASNYTFAEATGRSRFRTSSRASPARSRSCWRAAGHRSRSAQERRDQGVSLRPGRPAHDRRARAALRHDDSAGAPEVPARQSQGRSRCADRRAVAPRADPQRDVHEPRRAQRAPRELVAELNARTMRTYKASRRELFERLDMPALSPLPAEPFEARRGSRSASTSTTTSRSRATSTRPPTRCATRTSSCGCARRAARSRSSTDASASPRTSEASCAAATRRSPSTCRAAIARTPSGRPRASSSGPSRSGPTRARSARSSFASAATPSGVIARASGSFDSRRSTAARASTPPADGRSLRARAAIAPC